MHWTPVYAATFTICPVELEIWFSRFPKIASRLENMLLVFKPIASIQKKLTLFIFAGGIERNSPLPVL